MTCVTLSPRMHPPHVCIVCAPLKIQTAKKRSSRIHEQRPFFSVKEVLGVKGSKTTPSHCFPRQKRADIAVLTHIIINNYFGAIPSSVENRRSPLMSAVRVFIYLFLTPPFPNSIPLSCICPPQSKLLFLYILNVPIYIHWYIHPKHYI